MEPCDRDIDECNGESHECWFCGGNGWVEDDEWQNCDEDFLECEVCHGTGSRPCPTEEGR